MMLVERKPENISGKSVSTSNRICANSPQPFHPANRYAPRIRVDLQHHVIDIGDQDVPASPIRLDDPHIVGGELENVCHHTDPFSLEIGRASWRERLATSA